ncbi:uncharacterized membrane protein YoaK (UPF0700 family) [Clostridium acetobutylicum]|uniref:Uncharacterized conserved membrane protein, YOAK B.subtilis homolog n=1 Tax=Clostridium acetobutylicum (strain ATCC 824 / DSM 792 / JCM 1419 / IAM 19013 / LMG 5710 / NBRC 13948 / NRRL B-527 / VKM B-1787 / 2291 / W) TaxID=272562 RepID=Q97DV8_CLOAB|nr:MULTISPECIES: YoaK family protein [Clostridium]AAK81294.1 Uncharacterized conserved membrane protein, YOAK B.subtilis homolog [Clostridium acetobutylicum ATCC 824]ADZ22402.1 Conserved hypothetical protein [Clostridium acetobutylicum EA 2018]AEI32796.1 hypothetical protein SMB_G3399 [Clostridium acetobutylicum DSM 1731]AWV81039.1 DUF1275 domain-containing protein [Clostridium acetobutylicum]MBC2395553.1 DUF1275 domain-containing protein [Clostridium acetobutylicum]
MSTKDIDILQKNKISIPSFACESLTLGALLTVVGGFLDAYTFIGRGGVFANAQTANIVLLGINTFKGEFKKSLIYLLPIIAFILGVFAAEIIKKSSSLPFIPNWQRSILILEIIILFIIGFIPNSVSNSIINITVSFVASLQYCSFKKLGNSTYATTMCTGNLRSASLLAYTAFSKRDKEAAVKSIRYFAIIFAFICGVSVGGFLTLFTGVHAVWLVDILLLIILILMDLK